MIVFTDKEDRIIAYDSTNKTYKNKIDVGNYFDNKCDAFIFGHKCEPHYLVEVDEHNVPLYDKDGNLIYKLDKDGNKIQDGFSVYPDVPFLEVYQTNYEQTILSMADVLGGVYE